MKLVELLAKEMSDWPEDATHLTQSIIDAEVYNSIGDVCRGLTPRLDLSKQHDEDGYPEVTRVQWQAERDRQTGGEWKRHRGGLCPVKAGTKVSTKHRDGEVFDVHHHTAQEGSSVASLNGIWKHNGDSFDIMKYRIISQPQAEEVDVKDTTIGTLSYKVEIDTSEAHEALDKLTAKWDQIDGPLRWRDCVNELDAYIEKFTRERDALINRLAIEGFALLPAMTAVMGVADSVVLTDGDIVRCVEIGLTCADLTLGREYTICTIGGDLGVIDDEGDHMIGCADSGELEFIRRP